MTVRALKQLAEELEAEGLGDETEIRWLSQPGYPFEWSIAGYAIGREGGKPANDWSSSEREEAFDEDGNPIAFDPDILSDNGEGTDPIVYLIEGSQLGYASGDLFNNPLSF